MGSFIQRSEAYGAMSLMYFLVMSLLPFIAMAQQPPPTLVPSPTRVPPRPTPTPNDNLLSTGQAYALTWQRIVAGVVLITVGSILCFRGWRHFRFTMFLAGFIAGVIIVYSVLYNVQPQQGWNHSAIIFVFGCIAGGIVLGFLCWLLHRFTIAILGGLSGLVIALYILSWRDEGVIRSTSGRIGLMVGASALGLLIGLALGRRILIPATAIVGAYMSIVGLDLMARAGFNDSIHKFFTSNPNVQYHLTTNLYIMLGLVGGLMILGFLIQTFAWNRRRRLLLSQNRNPNHDNGWTVFGGTHPNANQGAAQPSAYQGNYDHGVVFGPNGVADQNVVYTEKKSWNPFKKNKTTVVRTNPEYANAPADNRNSLSSSAPLNA